MTSITASALRPWRSKWMRWRSPLPLLVGPGTVDTQLGSHSGMRLASEMRSKTSWMETPTVPVYVNETGRMGDNMAAKGGRDAKGGIAAKGGRDAKGGNGRQGTVGQTHHLDAPAAFCRPLADLIVSESRLDCRGCPSGGPDLRSASRRGCSSAGRAPGS